MLFTLLLKNNILKKIVIIGGLSLGFGVLLYLKPWRKEIKPQTRVIDRLPEADFIGSIDLLSFSKEIVKTSAFNQMKYRQLFSYDFLLSQSRSLGFNIQKPIYFFFNENKNGGFITEVNDFRKLKKGFNEISSQYEFEKNTKNNNTIYKLKNSEIHISFDENIFFLHLGEIKPKVLNKVFNARYNEVCNIWKELLSNNEKGIIKVLSKWEKLEDYGFKKCQGVLNIDSTNIYGDIEIEKEFPFNIEIKNGMSFAYPFNDRSVNLNLDISEFRKNPNDILYKKLDEVSNKYGLPFLEFLDVWTGDLSYRENGMVRTEEKYFETIIDEDFNTILEEKVKIKYIPNISAYISVNSSVKEFMKQLKKKGVVVKESESEKIRFLYSPPLKYSQEKNKSFLLSGNLSKKLVAGQSNKIRWSYDDIPFELNLNYLDRFKAKGGLSIKIEDFIKSKLISIEKISQ